MRKLAAKPLLLFLFLLSLTPAFIGLIKGPLNLRPRADNFNLTPEQLSLNTPSTQKLVSVSQELKNAPLSLATFHSSAGFEVKYDTNIWESLSSEPESHELTLKLKNMSLGFATFTLTPSYPGEITAPEIEQTIIGTFPATRHTLTETILGQDTPYTVYLINANETYFKIVIKSDQFNNSSALTDTLLANTTFTLTSSPSVEGATTDTQDLEKYEAAQIAELVKPSVVKILQLSCGRLTVNTTSATFKFLKSAYPFCLGSQGSGMIINDKGVIGTNGHVVKIYPETALAQNLFSPPLRSFLIDFIREIAFINTGAEMSVEQVTSGLSAITDNPNTANVLIAAAYLLMDKQAISLTEDESKIYIKLGNDPFVLDASQFRQGNLAQAVKTSPTIFQAKLIDLNFANLFSPDVILRKVKPTGSDVAILAVENPGNNRFPAVKLSTSQTVKEGSPLLVIGYPGLVEAREGDLNLLSPGSSTKPTLTKGIVSSIKQDEAGNNLIQTDASIDHGNSGGPAFNEAGEVVGIATYGFSSSSGNYNFLRDISDLKALLTKNQIDFKSNPTFDLWQTGLGNFWNNYYTKSLKNFSSVKSNYPIHPTADEFISSAQEAIKAGKDKGLLFGIDIGLAIGIIISLIALLALAIGVMVVVLFRRHSRDPLLARLPSDPLPPQPAPAQEPSPVPVPQSPRLAFNSTVTLPSTPPPSPAPEPTPPSPSTPLPDSPITIDTLSTSTPVPPDSSSTLPTSSSLPVAPPAPPTPSATPS